MDDLDPCNKRVMKDVMWHSLCVSVTEHLPILNRNFVHFLIVTDPGGQRRDQSPAQKVFGRLLSEPGRFAYAGLCGVSLGQLFQGPEQK